MLIKNLKSLEKVRRYFFIAICFVPCFLIGSLRQEAIEALPKQGYPTLEAWEHLILKDHRGIALPLISITSQKSSGCGEFLDLIPIIEWLNKSGLDLLQLLPIGDTGEIKSPYMPISSHALNSIYLSLSSLPYLDESPHSLMQKLEQLKENNLGKRVDYIKILREKESWIKNYLELFTKKLSKEPEYQTFFQKEEYWLSDYALFKVLSKKYGPIIKKWPEHLRAISQENKKLLNKKYQDQIVQECVLQYLCYDQMHFAHLFADHHAVFLMGDMPYMLSRDSVEVWLFPQFFGLDASLGRAPGYSTKEGEYWGMPSYNWKEIEADHYRYFENRLRSLNHYFDLYRIDHAQGFFNQFIIPLKKSPSEGHNEFKDEDTSLTAGKKRLTALAKLSSMLPTAEDLRFDAQQKKVIEMLGIPGVNIFVWMNRHLPIDKESISGKGFNLMTMTKLSNHDLPPFLMWWQENPKRAKAFAKLMRWKYEKQPTEKQQMELLWDQMHSNSLLHIEFLQDLLPRNLSGNPSDLRINFPGTNDKKDWSYRYPLTVEELVSNEQLRDVIKGMLAR